jgi:ParB family chromosome partitioning protein
MSKEKRLGRGLEALLGQLPVRTDASQSTQYRSEPASETRFSGSQTTRPAPPADFFEHPVEPAAPVSTIRIAPLPEPEPEPTSGPIQLRIGEIERNPHQPRQEFDPQELRSLAESLSTHGLLQPIVVRKVGNRYQLIAGERRLRAAEKAGWSEVPANLIEADDQETAELAIVENLQRKDLNALEKAASFQRYLDEYGCTQEELARRLTMDRSTIANLIRLLELPELVQESVRRGEITQGHARALLPLGDEREQIAFCARIKQENLNVRQTEAMVQQMIDSADVEPLAIIDRDGREKAAPSHNEHIAGLEQQFRAALGLKKVQISHNARGRGKLVIHFRNHEEFERIMEHICAPHPQISVG